jgi:hypothetical protein
MTSAPTIEHPDAPSRSGHSSRSPSVTRNRPKRLLFCPCGREAAPDEWRTERDGGNRRLVCPDCGETLTVR